jgi:pyrimidine-nucleoside phosphorylase
MAETPAAMHAVDLIRKKRDGHALLPEELAFVARGAAQGTIPDLQLSAWLMAAFLRGLDAEELRALTLAMRDSGDVLPRGAFAGRKAVDKHSTGGVGDKTSFLVAPIAAAAGLAVPMISGRALGHTGGTLDKLESIPGYRTQLSLRELLAVVNQVGCAIVGQTEKLVPADRKLYALRDVTATVESPHLICASIMSKKLAAGLDALVLDVKTGSGAFLKDEHEATFLAALMVQTGEAAGVRTVALVTSMDQPLGRYAGNACEIYEAMEAMRDRTLQDDLRLLSLELAGWMIHLGGRAQSPEQGMALAREILVSGEALAVFRRMIAAQGGDGHIYSEGPFLHPGPSRTVRAEQSGWLSAMDTFRIGMAVQRLGAGRERPEDRVAKYAGIHFLHKLGDWVDKGDDLAVLMTENASLLDGAEALFQRAVLVTEHAIAHPALVRAVVTRDNAAQFLAGRS